LLHQLTKAVLPAAELDDLCSLLLRQDRAVVALLFIVVIVVVDGV